MLNALLTQALREGASDIHIEPFERHSVVRFRVDGTLRDVVRPNRALHAALISRMKIMAELDIAEKRLPQDGRITLRIGTRAGRRARLDPAHRRTASARCCACSTRSASRLEPGSLGMSGDDARRVRPPDRRSRTASCWSPGPPARARPPRCTPRCRASTPARTNIMTVEDPIEYELRGIGQTQVNAKIDMTFAKALRAILRQDPDVIMIGEIRDLETAQIAVQASLTGHLVLATLHTNDAASAVTRLIDMGIEPFLLVVVAARRAGAAPGAQAVPALQAARGCAVSACGQTGYQGRTGVYELLVTNDADPRRRSTTARRKPRSAQAALQGRHAHDARRRRALGARRHHLARRAVRVTRE